MRGLSQYEHFLQKWVPEVGKRPTIQEIRVAETLARPGSKAAFALAMAARPQGVTQPQIVQVLGVPHRNKMKQVAQQKGYRLLKSDDGRGHRVFRLISKAA